MSAHGYGLEKRGNRWRVEIALGKNPVTGEYERYRETLPPGTSKSDAREMAVVIRDRIKRGYDGRGGNLSLQEYMAEYLDSPSLRELSDKTHYEYRSKMEAYVYPHLGSVYLSQLTIPTLQLFYDELARTGKVGQKRKDGKPSKSAGRPLSSKSIHHIHSILNKALKRAVIDGKIPSNPAEAVELPSKKTSKPRDTLNNKYVGLLEDLISTIDGRALATALSIGLHTGARKGEIAGLQWRDIDFDGAGGIGVLKIHRTLKEKRGGPNVYGETKTRGSMRTITMTTALREHLLRYQEQQEEWLTSLGSKLKDETPLLLNGRGEIMQLSDLGDRLRRFFKKYEFPQGTSLHVLRHTHVSYLLASGVPISTVSKRLGHSSITLTVDTYGHMVQGADEAAALVFEQALQTAREREKNSS